MAKTQFKLKFRCIQVFGSGGETQRAVIVAVTQGPLAGWMQALIACEDGTNREVTITQQDFELSAHNMVVMLEAQDILAPSVIYNPSAVK